MVIQRLKNTPRARWTRTDEAMALEARQLLEQARSQLVSQ
jgi:hypothetical protein